MTIKINSTQQEILKDLEVHSQVCLAVYGLLEMFSATHLIEEIFDVEGINNSLQHNGLLLKNPTGISETSRGFLSYIYPVDLKIKPSDRLNGLLCVLNPSEKAYLVAKAIFAKNTTYDHLDGFFKINGLLRQLETKGLLTAESCINDDGNALAVLICREIQKKLNLEIRK